MKKNNAGKINRQSKQKRKRGDEGTDQKQPKITDFFKAIPKKRNVTNVTVPDNSTIPENSELPINCLKPIENVCTGNKKGKTKRNKRVNIAYQKIPEIPKLKDYIARCANEVVAGGYVCGYKVYRESGYICFFISGNTFCRNVRRCHSNHEIYIVVHICGQDRGVWYQKCTDEASCKDFKSDKKTIPAECLKEIKEIPEECYEWGLPPSIRPDYDEFVERVCLSETEPVGQITGWAYYKRKNPSGTVEYLSYNTTGNSYCRNAGRVHSRNVIIRIVILLGKGCQRARWYQKCTLCKGERSIKQLINEDDDEDLGDSPPSEHEMDEDFKAGDSQEVNKKSLPTSLDYSSEIESDGESEDSMEEDSDDDADKTLLGSLRSETKNLKQLQEAGMRSSQSDSDGGDEDYVSNGSDIEHDCSEENSDEKDSEHNSLKDFIEEDDADKENIQNDDYTPTSQECRA